MKYSQSNVTTTTLSIEGMSCAGCVSRIEKSLNQASGIQNAAVNLLTATAKISYDEKIIGPADIKKSIEKLGYKVLSEKQVAADIAIGIRRDEELESLKKDFRVSAILTIPIVVINMVFAHDHHWLNYLLLIMTTFVLICGGKHFYRGILVKIRSFSPDMNVLVSLGTASSFIVSSIATFFPSVFFSMSEKPITYYDTTAVIITLVLMGRLLEFKAKNRASDTLVKLLRLNVKSAHLIRNRTETDVPVESLQIGDKILVKPGERIPADGIIYHGASSVDESAITGESRPADKKPGNEVTGATLNLTGSFMFEVKKTGKDTMFSQIIRLVEKAQTSKAPIQKLVDKIAAIFVPAILAIAVVTFIVWYFIIPETSLIRSIFTAVSVLVVACPCALGLATPTAIMVGSGKGAEKGIIFKNSRFIEQARKIDTIIFDKTGTITTGNLKVIELVTYPPFSKETITRLAASVERRSEHPFAKAIVNFAGEENILISESNNFINFTGAGAEAEVEGKQVKIGNLKWLLKSADENPEYNQIINDLGRFGDTAVVVVVDNTPAGIISFGDRIRVNAKKAIHELKTMGISPIMMTGDDQKSAESTGASVGISEIYYNSSPADKADKVRELQLKGRVTAVAGDGINDAPALTTADIGIAMGTGTEIATEAGDIVIVKGEIENVISAIKLSIKTFRTIQQNLFWAFIYNIILIPLAAAGYLDPTMAAGAMAFSSVSVVANSLRLRSG